MGLKSSIDYFVYPKEKLHPESARKGRLFIISTLIFLIFGLFGEVFIIATGFGGTEAVIGNGVSCLLFFVFFFLYKKYGWRVILVNIMAVMGLGSVQGTYYYSGGIFSSDFAFMPVFGIWVFLVANKKSGIIWFGINLVTLTVFYLAAANGWRDFKSDLLGIEYYYPFMNFFCCLIIIAVLIIIHENNKESYLKELVSAKTEMETQKKELEAQKDDILSSINYAKKIQYAVLPNEDSIYRSIPLSFILYKPRDIVSGDFFWFHEIDRDNYIIVCADCTGHGVPGAFMTVIGSNLLSQIVKETKITNPSEILLELDRRIIETLKQDKTRTAQIQDGMDLSLLKVDKANKEFTYTSAKRPAIFIRDKQIEEFKGSKLSLGGMRSGEKKFEEIKKKYEEDDMIYLFTDGYIDQFGGSDNKKFMIKRFRELLLSICNLSTSEQKQKLDSTITNWIGKNEQTDDIQVIGIRF